MLMGTFARPPSRTWPDEYGVMKLETVPRGIVQQTLMPLRGKKRFEQFVGGPEGGAPT
jgi:lathosterol oxidase